MKNMKKKKKIQNEKSKKALTYCRCFFHAKRR